MLAAFGPFAVVFEPIRDDRTPYLSLLHLHHERSLDVVRAIRDAVATPNSASCVLTLLRDVNWRPHLVGAIATYFDTTNDAITQMWAALDAGSWVTPQLAGILSKCDSDFSGKAISRLANCCPLSGDPEYSMESPIERHSAQGPAGSHHRSSKSAASLFALLPANDSAQFASNDDLQTLIADDFDGSADIAASWLESFLELDAQL
jgi:hypothetical protein